VQAIAQVVPIYWLGLGVRSAFLPDSAASWRSVRHGGTWRPSGCWGPGRSSLYLALRIAEYFEVPVEVVFSTTPFPRIGSTERSA
jgi:hypothetical protein